MTRKLLFLTLGLGGVALALAVGHSLTAANPAAPAKGGPDAKPAATLPISQVMLFNSGVGYFARAGEVEGDARVDLTFPETDINDLLKSMTLQDFGGGRVESVNYDSREPVGRTLSSFSINLSANPTLAQILSQVRGEKVEVSVQPTAQAQPGSLSGTIVGIEKQKLPAANKVEALECDVLNLLTADGLRAVKLTDVLRLKFTNPVLESELKRALDVLALSHDTLKKSVALNFTGEGKRRVKVGYVVESPVWKTSYRLVLDKDNKPFLQGWAMVENPTDEDWSNVKMALVSGRPISFKMDLYNPLYVGRPTVEPELFASLRPPTYQGDIAGKAAGPGVGGLGGRMDFGGGGGGFGALGSAAPPGTGKPLRPTDAVMPAAGGEARSMRREQADQEKEFAKKTGEEFAEKLDLSAAASAATAGQLGDFFQYVIDHPVNLPRQKSALLPIVNKDVGGTRVSIYNPAVQAKHPLLGFRFKNSTGAHLAQGPITVFEGSSYAGDARVLDLQPNEERLIAYAIDLGTEVVPQNGQGSAAITSVKASRGVVTTTRKFREELVYKAVNRSGADRTLLIEHPNRKDQGFALVETPKAAEETANLLRFELALPAGKSAEFKVVEEHSVGEQVSLTNSADDTFRFFLNLKEVSPALKEKLTAAMALKGKLEATRREAQVVNAEVQRIGQDQARVRQNLREIPKEAEVYATYLKKFSAQEKEIEALTEKQKALAAQDAAAQREFAAYLDALTD